MTTTVGQLIANNTSNNTIKTANASKTTKRTTTANSPHSPRNARICPQSTIFNTFTSILLMLAITMCAVSGGRVSGVGVAAAPSPNPTTNAAATILRLNTVRSSNRTRLQKRDYNNFKALFYNELNRPALYWSNACGGTQVESSHKAFRPRKRCALHKKVLRTLQNKVGGELRQLRRDNKLRHPVHSLKAQDTATNQAIDLSQHRIWVTQSDQYNFLPRLNNSHQQLSLRRAHHDLQFYVAAFSYLLHAQLHYDYENLQRKSVLSAELWRLRASARTVLCIVEEAINGSSQLYAPIQKHQRHKLLALGRIKTVSLHLMEKRLQQFQTSLVELHRQAWLAANNQPAVKPSKPPVDRDMLFIKYQYLEYLKHMTQLLAKQRKKECKTNKRKQQIKQQLKKA